jgi:hypothetical protein
MFTDANRRAVGRPSRHEYLTPAKTYSRVAGAPRAAEKAEYMSIVVPTVSPRPPVTIVQRCGVRIGVDRVVRAP